MKEDGNKNIRVLLADDHAVLRKGLSALMAEYGGIEVVGEAENGAEAVKLATRLKPDVVVMDLMMPVMDGLAATLKILEQMPEANIMVLTTFGEAEAIRTALKSGAKGAVTKDLDPDELVAAIRAVAAGGSFVSSSLKGLLEEDDGMESLTQRQREILADIANGLSNKGISEKYSIALPTVKDHIRLIFEKLDVSNRAGAAALAIRRKMA
ncbi:MAG: response regulator transcription factor [Kiritimatiellae bacterium]|nr:response regulator transcription factor [Kiritimatiellia bacterium]